MHDPRECPKCEARAKARYERFQTALKAVSATQQGREVLDYILDQTGVNAPALWEPSSKINYNVSRRDLGKEIETEIMRANLSGYFTLLQDRFNASEIERIEVEKEEKGRK